MLPEILYHVDDLGIQRRRILFVSKTHFILDFIKDDAHLCVRTDDIDRHPDAACSFFTDPDLARQRFENILSRKEQVNASLRSTYLTLVEAA